MRNIKIIAVGRIKQSAKYLEAGIALYQKRIQPYAKITWVELPEVAPSATRPVEQILEKEADLILKQLDNASQVVLLNERGKLHSSETFSQWLFPGNPPDGGRASLDQTPMIFIIGGAYGTSNRITKRATDVISLSALTFPHQMVRLLLMEQLYRAYSIALNEPYHKV